MIADRYNRSVLMFGVEGQAKIERSTVSVVGAGGLGCIVVQHLLLLGVKLIYIIDFDLLDETSRNRFVAAKASDPNGKVKKAALLKRLGEEINPTVIVEVIDRKLETKEAFDAIRNSDFVFGCVDEDGPRSILNELCAAYEKPYIDAASDVLEDGAFGGRVVTCIDGNGCLSCAGVLDRDEIQKYFENENDRSLRRKIYGIDHLALAKKGPSVSPLNGVIASLAAMEFVLALTGFGTPQFHLEYRGHLGTITKVKADSRNCRICKQVRGSRKGALAERHIETVQTGI